VSKFILGNRSIVFGENGAFEDALIDSYSEGLPD